MSHISDPGLEIQETSLRLVCRLLAGQNGGSLGYQLLLLLPQRPEHEFVGGDQLRIVGIEQLPHQGPLARLASPYLSESSLYSTDVSTVALLCGQAFNLRGDDLRSRQYALNL